MGAVTAHGQLIKGLQKSLLALLFAGSLSLAYLDHDLFLFAWFAFVPLLVATRNTSLIATYLISVLAGFCLFATATYWISDFLQISKGQDSQTSLLWASLYWFYCAHLVALLFVSFHILKRLTKLHEFILFPLMLTLFTSFYPMLFSMHLGESQVRFLWAIQATEYIGVHGLDAIVALVNILLYRLVVKISIQRDITTFRLSRPVVVASSIIFCWFVVGGVRFYHWESKLSEWPVVKVGIVQPDETPSLGRSQAMAGYSKAYPPELEMTRRLSQVGADIVVWSEAKPKGYWDNTWVQDAYQREISGLGTSLVFQDMQRLRDPLNGAVRQSFNSAAILSIAGNRSGSYQKIKRIPFGEYLPLVSQGSALHSWLSVFFGRFSSELSAGKESVVFFHDKVNIIPLICYETTFPDFVAGAVGKVAAKGNNNLGSLLIGMSNDGWFGSTHQPFQHILPSVLRSVENRVPMVHAVNNGPSLVVLPSGRIQFQSQFQQAGGYLVDVPVSTEVRGSLYSQYPWGGCILLLVVSGWVVLLAMKNMWSQSKGL